MQVAGIIAEYNPLHCGHLYLMEQVRSQLGGDTAILCVMSGNFVQRGDFALLRKHARAEAAVRSGADLVLELPLPWAVSSAERFAVGGVETLLATGVLTHLAFGSESGDVCALQRVAAVLNSRAFSTALRDQLRAGDSFAAARQRVVAALLSQEDARLLESPNNILGVEYLRCLLSRGTEVQPLTVSRRGTAHDGQLREGEFPSASAIRGLFAEGKRDAAFSLLPKPMAAIFRREEAAGRAPVFFQNCQRAILARLRQMEEVDFFRLDEGREGLCNRLYAASRTAASVEDVLSAAKTKRYALSRLRRMVLWAYLGLAPGDVPEAVPYLRVLAANGTGRAVLRKMQKAASVPVLTKPAGIRRLPASAKELFQVEARATDLYTLAYPDLSSSLGGMEWREGPVIV